MKTRKIKVIYISIMLAIFTLISLFPNHSVSAKTTEKTAYVDIDSGVLNIRSGPGTKYKVIGTVQNNSKLSIYSQKNNWAETSYKKKKGYVSNEFLRYYMKMSNKEAKRISDKSINTLRKVRSDRNYTKKQLKNIWEPSFTSGYINKLVKYDMMKTGKDKYGNALYSVIPTDFPYYWILFQPDWKQYYASKPPTVKYYKKNGKEYLKVNSKYTTEMYEHNIRLSLTRKSSKDNWKVYDYKW